MADELKTTETKHTLQLRDIMFWRADSAIIAYQVRHYHSLRFYQSARGRSMLCFLSAVIISMLLVRESQFTRFFAGAAFLLFLGFFMYRGHRWAFITSMIVWINAILPDSHDDTANVFRTLICAFVLMIFWQGFLVEQRRRKESAGMIV